MDVDNIENDFSHLQDLTGQLSHKIYTPITFAFPLQDTSSKSSIIDVLSHGLERLSSSFQWLAGKVVLDGPEGKSGLPIVKSFEKTCRLIVRDYTNDTSVPSMEAFVKANFPHSMLDGMKFTSLSGAPSAFGNPEEGLYPVFFVQANFINGGLLLSISGEHSMIDGQGLGQIIQLFSKACHDIPFTDEELLQGNRSRRNIIPFLDQSTYKPGPELEHLLAKPNKNPPPTSNIPISNQPPPEATWAYFHFPASSLSKLKSLASASPTLSTNHPVPYISTNDALSAFIWQTISRIRLQRLPPNTDLTTTFARAVDIRPSLSIPPTYLGNLSSHTYHTYPLKTLQKMPLSTLSTHLRQSLNHTTLKSSIQSLATHLSLHPTGTNHNIQFGINMDFQKDIMFSSWAGLTCYNQDFNLGLGYPVSVRRPGFMAIESLMYLMPMDREKGIDFAVCLRGEDLDGLKGDVGFGEFACWIG